MEQTRTRWHIRYSIILCLFWELILDVFKSAILMCCPCWCIWHVLCFLWKCITWPLFFFGILKTVRFGERRTGTNGFKDRSTSRLDDGKGVKKTRRHEDNRCSKYVYPPPSLKTVQDTKTYCQRYPGQQDNLSLCDNWLFYSNKKKCGRNEDMSIDEVFQDWFKDYSLLETRHDYIQWLFPIREQSMFNYDAQSLQLHEAEKICEDPAARERVLKSYRMMLDFWGMDLKDEESGTIERGDNWQERFRHLNCSSHNYLRITCMLKSLGELGFERLKFPFLTFILYEVFLEKTLINAAESCLHYWINLLRDDKEKRKIHEIALEYLGSALWEYPWLIRETEL